MNMLHGIPVHVPRHCFHCHLTCHALAEESSQNEGIPPAVAFYMPIREQVPTSRRH